MRSVLLTGASGFIGRHCLSPLLERGYQVHAVSRREVEDMPGVHWHAVDLLDATQTAELVTRVRPSHLLHLAWITTPGRYWTSPENLRWVSASLDLLRRFVSAGGRRVVVAGTCAEYDWRYGFCVEGVTPLAPATLYGSSKHALQLMLQSWAAEGGCSAAWGRVFFLYGPGEHPTKLVASVIRSLLQDRPAPCSSGWQLRDFLYVGDVADAFVALLDGEVSGPVNIASGRPVAVREVVQRLGDLLARPDLLRLGALPDQEEPGLLAGSAARLALEVGWHPALGLVQGLERSIEWWSTQLRAPAAGKAP